MITISCLYDDYDSAARAVADLERAGIPHGDISLVANNAEGWAERDRIVDRDGNGIDDRSEGARTGAGVGMALGGMAGLLAGLGLIAIPGLGPVVAAGWLVSTGVGALAAGAAGGIIGALTQAGVGENEAHVYAEGIRRGGTLVTAQVPDADRMACEAILNRNAVDVPARADTWERAGWNRFDPQGRPLTVEEIRRERDTYRRM